MLRSISIEKISVKSGMKNRLLIQARAWHPCFSLCLIVSVTAGSFCLGFNYLGTGTDLHVFAAGFGRYLLCVIEEP